MRTFAILVAACLIAAPQATRADSGPRLDWQASDGRLSWSVPLSRPGADATAQGSLAAPPWHKKLPDIDVRLLGGGVLRLREARGSVLALSFWATWCAPCRLELPRLERAYRAHREEGLQVVAINVSEPLDVAVPFARDLDLTMPIGLFDEAMRPALYGNTLPVLVLADREGNMRGRWDGFEPGFETEIDGLIRLLLSEEREPSRQVAAVRIGAGRYDLAWFRELKARVDGLAVAPGQDDKPAILVSHGALMSEQNPDGSTARQWVGDRAAGRVRLAPAGHPSEWTMASFRPGARQIVLLAASGGEPHVAELDDPVFDVAWVPEPIRDATRVLAVGTLGGVSMLDGTGRVTGSPEGFGTVAALSYDPGPDGDPRLLVLESDGRLSWVDPMLRVVRRADTPPDPWLLISGDAGAVGIASDQAVAAARGRFIADGGRAVALATRDGRLLIVSETDGGVLLDAEWPEISGLAAGDLDGDGVDELAVSAGSWLGVVTAVRATVPSSGPVEPKEANGAR